MADLKCPNCARDFVRRVSRAGLGERLLSVFYVYPFKCQLCGYRFRFFQWGVRYFRVEEDRREYDRMEMTFPVAFTSEAGSGEGALVNVSMGGNITVAAGTLHLANNVANAGTMQATVAGTQMT